MSPTPFQEFMALMRSTGADTSIRAIATAYRVASPEDFISSVEDELYKAWSTRRNPIQDFRAWAKRAALNAAKRERQSATRQQSSHVSFEELEEMDSLLRAGGADSLHSSTPAERLDVLTELDFIFGAIKSLPPKERDAICNLLERVCGDRPEEHLSGAEKKALYRARQTLQQSLESTEHPAAGRASLLLALAAPPPEQLDASNDLKRRFLQVLSSPDPEREGDAQALFRQLISLLRDGEPSCRQLAHGKARRFFSHYEWKKRG